MKKLHCMIRHTMHSLLVAIIISKTTSIVNTNIKEKLTDTDQAAKISYEKVKLVCTTVCADNL